MDMFSHGLWGGMVLGRKKDKKGFFLVFLISMLPDLLSIGVFWVGVFLGFSEPARWIGWHLDYSSLPPYVDTLYTLTHSLWVFSLAFMIIWYVRNKPFMPLLAWAVHILIDIPSHSLIAFPTPFLWPFSNYVFNGYSWIDPMLFFPNVFLLMLIYGGYLFFQRSKEKQVDKIMELDDNE